MKRIAVLICTCLWLVSAAAANESVRAWSIDKPLDVAYKVIYQHLESNDFYVVFEPDIQGNMRHFAERWGENYNRNKLEGIRAMVFCNGWYANQVSNADPDMLALCPLHITLIQQLGKTRVLFVRPSVVAAGSRAQVVAKDLEEDVVKAVNAAVDELRGCPATC